MLVLTHKERQSSVISLAGHVVEVVVIVIEGNRVKIGYQAPPSVSIDREEIFHRKRARRERESVPLGVLDGDPHGSVTELLPSVPEWPPVPD